MKNIVNVVSARRVHQSDWKSTGVPFYRAREIGKLSEQGFVENDLFISEELFSELSKSGVPHKNDLMITAVGTLGKVYIVKEGDRFYYKDASVICLENFGKIIPEYLKVVIHSPYLTELIKKKSAGTTVDTITIVKANEYLIPLPPKNEQQRIVCRINDCVPALEKYNENETRLSKMNKEFPELLKKSILQQAIMGRLVPQNLNDEPASVLLEKIRAEKNALIKAGKLKKDKHESIIYRRDNSHYEKLDGIERCIDDEIPFEIPDNWCWCRLGDIGDTNIGLTYKPSDKTTSDGILVLRSSNIQNGKMNYTDCVFVSCEIPERAMIHKGDILICARNGSRSLVGKCAIVDKDGMAFGAFMAKFQSLYNPYIKLFLDSPLFRNQLDGVKTETINQITQDMLKSQLIPLPPLKEQEKIIREVNRIVPFLERL